MRKTKIICTLGPASDTPEMMEALIKSGMNVARFNFSHGSHQEHKGRLDTLKAAREKLDIPVGALLDTKGPEIRLKTFAEGKEVLEAGQTFTLTTREVVGSKEICGISYRNLPQDVKVGTTIMLDDGLIRMTALEVTETDIVCRVENGGPIKDRKGVNVPGVHLSMPYMSKQDREDILFGIQEGFDYVAASFCRSAQDVLEIRRLLDEHQSNMRIIAKLENQEGVDNVDEILAVADGIMIARGDMGVEIDFTEIPVIQKDLISRALSVGKHVITATQMLDSMSANPRPTRAEITDVANAVYDGTSAVMLSGETAAGKYPVETLQTMAAIAERTEQDINYFGRMKEMTASIRLGIGGATAHAACTTAVDTNATAIITVTTSGATPRLISRFRPDTPIIACVMNEDVRRQLALTWGVTPLIMDYVGSTDEMIEGSVKAAQEAGLIQDGDLVVVTAGVPAGIAGTTNMMKVHLVGNSLITGAGVGERGTKGTLCVCRNVADVKSKFHPGVILVVPHTNNEMLPYIREAAGIIAEENGLGSHAAVVGLSLNKPVIVGAIGATRTLHDGMKVSMDCRQGAVQSLVE
ncbi:pyruvate kinase [Evtepia sp.]|uniref:pyruvate kinase n=1 Tax=Evtepia sp. TaxID=2773933 RepID=UPI003F16C389